MAVWRPVVWNWNHNWVLCIPDHRALSATAKRNEIKYKDNDKEQINDAFHGYNTRSRL